MFNKPSSTPCLSLLLSLPVYIQTLRSCSENFPIEDYTININNSRGFTVPSSTLPPPGNTLTVKISDRDIPQLQRDMVYSLTVTACSNFTCKQSDSIPFCECNGLCTDSPVPILDKCLIILYYLTCMVEYHKLSWSSNARV